jgi:hypothetical protein
MFRSLARVATPAFRPTAFVAPRAVAFRPAATLGPSAPAASLVGPALPPSARGGAAGPPSSARAASTDALRPLAPPSGMRFSSHESETYDEFNARYQEFFNNAPDLFEVQVRRLALSLPRRLGSRGGASFIEDAGSCEFTAPSVVPAGRTGAHRTRASAERSSAAASLFTDLPRPASEQGVSPAEGRVVVNEHLGDCDDLQEQPLLSAIGQGSVFESSQEGGMPFRGSRIARRRCCRSARIRPGPDL